jgi:predicted amidohydrolase YtcJ
LTFTGGPVVTLDRRQPTAEAVAVEDGRIVAVGRQDEVEARAGGPGQLVDLAGRALLPGFVEAHGHPLNVANVLAPPATDVRPFGTATGAEVERRIRDVVRSRPPGTPCLFYGIDPLLQRDLTLPTMADLDRLAPEHPILVVSNSGHAGYGNRLLFDAAQVDRHTVDPPGAEFMHGPDGELTGEAREVGAVFALAVPLVGAGVVGGEQQLRWACEDYARAGFTTVSDMAYSSADRRALADVTGASDAPIRIRAYEMGTPALAADRSHRPTGAPAPAAHRFAQIGMKLWADGSPWQGNIATSFPYLDTDATRAMGLGSCHHGDMNYTAEQLQGLAGGFADQGWQLACHVHGDVAIDVVLDAYEAAADRTAGEDRRPRLEHCGAMRPDQYDRAAGLGVTVSLFIQHLWYWGDVLVDGLFGPEHGGRWMAARSALDAGVRISLHNDGMVTPPDPLGNIATAVNRRAKGSGRVIGAEQCISLDEALRAQTIDAAWQLFLDQDLGTIETGKHADLVVLSADPRAVSPDAIGNLEVVATFLDGRQTAGEPLW